MKFILLGLYFHIDGAAGDGSANMDEEQVLVLADALGTSDGASACVSQLCQEAADGVKSAAVSMAEHRHVAGHSTASAIFSQLGSLVSAKLAAIQSLDPASVQSLSESMSQVVDAMNTALNAEVAETLPLAMAGIATYISSIQQHLTDPMSAPMSVHAMQMLSAPFAKGTQGTVACLSLLLLYRPKSKMSFTRRTVHVVLPVLNHQVRHHPLAAQRHIPSGQHIQRFRPKKNACVPSQS